MVNLARFRRQIADWATLPRDLIAFGLVMIIPGWRGGLLKHLQFALLPYAGSWAYRDDPWVAHCRREYIATGQRPEDILADPSSQS